MARARNRQTTSSNSTSAGPRTLVCPECGKQFTRPASLGAHRRAAHGVQGSSGRARRSRAPVAARRTRANGSPRTRSTVDRDALLRTLFPNGIPAREQVIRELDRWLQEAERLARLS